MPSSPSCSARAIDRLLSIMDRLRDPQGGCPWDLEQSFATIAPHTIEEAYEVVEAIESGDRASLKDELGDLLFQVVFYARLGKEEDCFDFESIAEAISEKMLRRHPHVSATPTSRTPLARLPPGKQPKPPSGPPRRTPEHWTAYPPPYPP